MVGEGASVVSANDHGLIFHSVPTDTVDVIHEPPERALGSYEVRSW